MGPKLASDPWIRPKMGIGLLEWAQNGPWTPGIVTKMGVLPSGLGSKWASESLLNPWKRSKSGLRPLEYTPKWSLEALTPLISSKVA